VRIPIPEQDEQGHDLSLENFQEHSVRDILRTLDQGAVIGRGRPGGRCLGTSWGRARPSSHRGHEHGSEVPPRPGNLYGIGS
jgi:hypothetical protein